MTGPHRNLPPPPSIPGTKTTSPFLHQLQSQVSALLHRNNTRFPGAQPISFSRKHVQELQDRDYYVCEKSDGIRCLMWLTENDQGEEMVFLIDRKNDYYLLADIHFPQPDDEVKFHVDTIIDGELVNDLQKDGSVAMKYLVFDCLVLDGMVLLEKTLDKRLGYYLEKVSRPFVKLYNNYPEEMARLPFYVESKKMERAYGLQMIFETILPNLAHGNDGLIFTCRTTAYQPGTDPHIIKWKPPNENSIDFRLYLEFPPLSPPSSPEPNHNNHNNHNHTTIASNGHPSSPNYDATPTFHLAIGMAKGEDALFSTMHVTPSDFAHLKSLNRPLDEAIVECYQDDEHRWRFMRVRDDKMEPNHVSTVDKVMESIADRVTKEDLVGIGKKVRENWKEREKRAAQNA